MDPVSSVLSIISFGLSVLQAVQSLSKLLKAAPARDQLQTLQDSCTAVTLLLLRLEEVHRRGSYNSMHISETKQPDQLWISIVRYLEDVDSALKELVESIENMGEGRFRRFASCLRKWYFKRDRVETVAKKLSVLQTSLHMMVNLTNSHFLERLMTRTEGLHSCNCSEVVDRTCTSRDNELPYPSRCQCARNRLIAVTPTPPDSYSDGASQSQCSLPLPERHFASDGVQTRAVEAMWVPPEVRQPHPPEHFSPRLPLSRPFDPRPASSPYPLQSPRQGILAIEEVIGCAPPPQPRPSIRTFALDIVFHVISDNGSISTDYSSFTKLANKLL